MMKAILTTLILHFCLLPSAFHLHAQVTPGTFRTFNDTLCLPVATPMQLLAGEKVFIDCDTAYLMNKERFRLLMAARQYILGIDPDAYMKVVVEYERGMGEWKKSFDDLYGKYEEASGTYALMLEENQRSLTQVTSRLDRAFNEIQAANRQLEEAGRKIRDQQKARVRTGLLWGGLGVGIGILTGLLLGQ